MAEKVVHDSELLRMALATQQARQRFEMAQQSMQGAAADYADKEARLKGACEYRFGPDFSMSLREGKIYIDPHGGAAAANGAPAITPQQLNRAARRSRAQGKKS